MEDRFLFKGTEREVVGIDENGYGPIIGPLIITGIRLKLPFDSIYSTQKDLIKFNKMIKDSKKVFTRSLKSYKRGEFIALSILNLAGLTPFTFYSLLSLITNNVPRDLPDFSLPTWWEGENISYTLLSENIKIDGVYVNVFSAQTFNYLIDRFQNKAFVDFLGFKGIRDNLKGDIYMMGKIGGTKAYLKFFELIGEYPEPVVEKRELSYYKAGDTELYFLLNGDEMYLPLMLAGIVGKYVRELYMKAICEKFGLFGKIPFASGYGHDKNTEILKRRIEEKKMSKFFIRKR